MVEGQNHYYDSVICRGGPCAPSHGREIALQHRDTYTNMRQTKGWTGLGCRACGLLRQKTEYKNKRKRVIDVIR